MKPLTASEVEYYLRMHGFVHVRTKGSHYIWTHPRSGVTTTVPHHGNRTLPQGLLNGIFTEAGIPKLAR